MVHLRARSSEATPMVRECVVALCCGAVMSSGGFGFGWFIIPEPAELKLRRILVEVPALRCIMMWVGTAGPEIWCPAVPPLPEEPEQQPAVPTS
jgi:hypothetical protein